MLIPVGRPGLTGHKILCCIEKTMIHIKIFLSPEKEGKSENMPKNAPLAASEDIINPGNAKKAIINDDSQQKSPAPEEENDDINIVQGTEADVTEEDLKILGPRESDMDMGDDETTPRIIRDEDDEPDVPGAELDDENEDIGEEDEENNYYSLGGDRQQGEETN